MKIMPRRVLLERMLGGLAGGLAISAFGAGVLRPVRVDSGGMLVIDGRRKFILGLYQLPKVSTPWRAAADAGFDLVHVNPKREELDLAREHKLYGWANLGSIAPARRDQDEKRIRNLVTNLKDHPALLFWETEDEPSFQWKKPGPRIPPENILAAGRLIRSLDPAHPLYINHAPTNTVNTLQQYNAAADIVATDTYPVIPPGIREQYALWPDGKQGDLLNPDISQVGQYADKMRQVAGPARAVFMVLQAFAWETLREKDVDPKMVLYPTRDQLRFMCYQSIVHRVTGILFWGLAYTPLEAQLWDDLRTVARELHALRSELAAPALTTRITVKYHDEGHSIDRGIEWIIKPSDAGALLIGVNADRNPVKAVFQGLRQYGSYEKLEASEKARLNGGTFTDSFKPFDVHVYRLRLREA